MFSIDTSEGVAGYRSCPNAIHQDISTYMAAALRARAEGLTRPIANRRRTLARYGTIRTGAGGYVAGLLAKLAAMV
jgi:hypothetical protein